MKPQRQRVGKRRRGLRHDDSGQATVEFAFVMFMMMVLVMGLVDFARLYLQYQVITDTAREGARRAVVENAMTADEVYADILSFLTGAGIDTSNAARTASCGAPAASVTVVTIYECSWEGAVTGDPVRVGISVPYQLSLLGPMIGWLTSEQMITLRTTFAMRKE